MAFFHSWRRLSSTVCKGSVPYSCTRLLCLSRRHLCISCGDVRRINAFSTSASSFDGPSAEVVNPSDAKTSLSARMQFVFDQIDAMEEEIKDKHETLQRIRAWREKKQKPEEKPAEEGLSTTLNNNYGGAEVKDNLFTAKDVEVVHPWPEWIEFMQQLVRQNYFDHRRKAEYQTDQDATRDPVPELVEEGFDFTRDWVTVRTSCINFGRDRFDILRSLSRKDIQVLVGHGCPSTDPKVVFSAKMLRKHVHIDEGDVCSSCSLRSSCTKAFLVTNKEDEARTLDITRILLTFGFHPINGSIDNEPLTKMKPVKMAARRLLHEIVKLSSVPIDPNLPPPIIKKPPPKVKQPPPPPKKRVGRDDIEMKKGDWLCPKCDFMNFAKNAACLRCDAKRPKRQLLPGEWECPECNFLNYRRNMVCFHCDCKRPPDEYVENRSRERPMPPGMRLDRPSRVPGVSDVCNFDFDENESDGADVASFEFADPPKMSHNLSSEEVRLNADDSYNIRNSRYKSDNRLMQDGQNGSTAASGFDDFEDVDNFETDDSSTEQQSFKNYSKFETPHTNSGNYASISYDCSDSDFEEQSYIHDRQKSGHIVNSRSSKFLNGPYAQSSLSSDNESGFDSESDVNQNFKQKVNEGKKKISRRMSFRREISDSEGRLSFESDDEHYAKKCKNKSGHANRQAGSSNSSREKQWRFNGRVNSEKNPFAAKECSFGGSYRAERGTRRHGYGGLKENERENSRASSSSGVRRGLGTRSRGRSDRENRNGGFAEDGVRRGLGTRSRGRFDRENRNGGFAEEMPRRRVIER